MSSLMQRGLFRIREARCGSHENQVIGFLFSSGEGEYWRCAVTESRSSI
jgi:proteasome lid subunit RPN8/RPN11